MPSPRRIYRYLSTPDIEALIAAAKERQLKGAFTSLSGGGHSSTRQFADDAMILEEATHELNVRNGTVAPSRTSSTFAGLLENNTTVDA
jgi:hypothetical protein